MVSPYVILIGVLAAERLFELWLSRRNARLQRARGAVEMGAAHFPYMALIHTLFLASCLFEGLQRPFPGLIGWIALLGAAAAQALRYWAIATLGPRWNVRVLVVPGDAPIQTGPYQFLHHPNYVAVAAEMLCVPLIHGAWITALLFSTLNAAILAVRIRVEDRALGYSRG
jgi:methyltransferase